MQRLRFLLIAFCVITLSPLAQAKVILRDGVYYALNYETKTASVTSGDEKYHGEVYIAGWVEADGIRFNVTEIGESAFRDCIWLTLVSLPNSIISIGKHAFNGCSDLIYVNMSNSLTSIGNHAFANCTSLSSIKLPKSVVSIGERAFYRCHGFTSITIPDSVTSIGYGAFDLCVRLTSITIPNSVTDLGKAAFYYCRGLTTAIIGDSVTSIKEATFYCCSALQSVTIGNSVTSIDDEAFCKTPLKTVNIPNTVTSIGNKAFYQTYLDSVTIPNSVTSIGNEAFCESYLDYVTIPNSVTSIGWLAFSKCPYLKSVTIGKSVKDIGGGAFEYCKNLKNIVCCAETIPTLGNYTFTNSDCTLYVPFNSIDSYKSSTQWNFFKNIIGFTGIPTESISLSNTSVTLQSGNEIQLSPTVSPVTAVNNPLIWNSSDPSVATVDSNGLVRAVSVGEVTVSASFANIKAECIITVETTPVSGITLSQTSTTLGVTEETQLTATVSPETATDKTVTWTSSNTDIATVDANGKIKAISLGNATITATCGNVSATCMVTVVPTLVQSISLTPTEWSGSVGDSFSITAILIPANATEKTLNWTSDDNAIATVDRNGTVTVVGVGNCVITAIATDGSDVSAVCRITVNPILVESISLDPATWSGEENSQFIINATVLPENATDKTLKWISSNKAVAIVDESGFVSVFKEGNCVISAKSTDGSDISAECIVTSSAGIDDIFVNAAERFDIYNMQGVLIKKNCNRDSLKMLSTGVYMIRQGIETRTLMIK